MSLNFGSKKAPTDSDFPSLPEVSESTSATQESGRFSRFSLTMVSVGAAVALMAGCLVYGVNAYNNLITRDETVGAAWSEVLNMYRRRADLLPNVINAVQTYAAHERGLLTELAEARAAMLAGLDNVTESPQALAKLQSNQQKFHAGLGHLMAVAERYPELKANTMYQDLIVELEGSENRISYARSHFIGAVAEYNMAVRHFPGNLIANRVGLKLRPTFDDNLKTLQQPPVVKVP